MQMHLQTVSCDDNMTVCEWSVPDMGGWESAAKAAAELTNRHKFFRPTPYLNGIQYTNSVRGYTYRIWFA